jgi:hypothetical protein
MFMRQDLNIDGSFLLILLIALLLCLFLSDGRFLGCGGSDVQQLGQLLLIQCLTLFLSTITLNLSKSLRLARRIRLLAVLPR